MDHGTRPSAPDYTTAFLWMALVNVMWILGLVWAVLGMPAALLTAWALNRGIACIGARRS